MGGLGGGQEGQDDVDAALGDGLAEGGGVAVVGVGGGPRQAQHGGQAALAGGVDHAAGHQAGLGAAVRGQHQGDEVGLAAGGAGAAEGVLAVGGVGDAGAVAQQQLGHVGAGGAQGHGQAGVEGDSVGVRGQHGHQVGLAALDGALQHAAAVEGLEAAAAGQQVGAVTRLGEVDVAAGRHQLGDEGLGHAGGPAVGHVGVEGAEDVALVPLALLPRGEGAAEPVGASGGGGSSGGCSLEGSQGRGLGGLPALEQVLGEGLIVGGPAARQRRAG